MIVITLLLSTRTDQGVISLTVRQPRQGHHSRRTKQLLAYSILIIEADAEVGSVLEILLRRSGYAVTRTPDAMEAIETILREPPDLVILDPVHPGIDGWEMCHLMGGSERARDTPVIVYTSQAYPDDATIRGFALAGYFTKPYATLDVVRHAVKVLASKHP